MRTAAAAVASLVVLAVASSCAPEAPAVTGTAPSATTADRWQSDASADAAAPRQAGTYRYDTTGAMTVGGADGPTVPELTTLTVEPAWDGRQRAVREARDPGGPGGQTTETVLLYRADGVFLVAMALITSAGDVRDVRSWSTDVPELLLSSDAEPGDVRRFSLRDAGTTADVTARVLRREPVTVGDGVIDTLVTEIHVAFVGAVEGFHTTTTWLRPSDLLPLQEHSRTDVDVAGTRVTVHYDARLRSTSPTHRTV